MSATANLLDGVDLRNVKVNGMIHEEVLNRIIDASPTDTPFLSAIGSSSIGNDFFEWPLERLASPVIDAQVVDGSSGRNDQSTLGARIRSWSEIRTKTIRVSTRSNELNTIGFARALVRQLNRRGLELMRDINATWLSNNAMVPSSTTAPQTGGLYAWGAGRELVPTAADDTGGAGNPATQAFGSGDMALLWDAQAAAADTAEVGWAATSYLRTAGGALGQRTINATTGALTETAIRALANGVWRLGNQPSKVHARPELITKLSVYMFTSSARIATQIADRGESGPRKAVGATNEFMTDFGVTLSFVPDRQMNLVTDGSNSCSAVYVYDPSCVETAVLMGNRVKVLATDGLTENREIQCDKGLKVLDPHGIGTVINVDEAAAVTA